MTARIKDQMLAADPFLANDGSPADALDFFAMFIGAHPIREEYWLALYIQKRCGHPVPPLP